MIYFQLYPHCCLVAGSVHDAIFDIFQERVFWLKESPYREAVRALEQGNSLKGFSQDTGNDLSRIRTFVNLLVAMDYGTYQDSPSYSEKFRPIILSGQEEAFTLHRPLTRGVVEISSRCSLKCSICGFKNGWATSLCACGVWASQCESMTVDISRLVLELSAYGCGQLHIQGGDPFLERQTLQKLVTEAKERNLNVSVQSPLVNLMDEDWEFIKKTGLELVVPVFGADGKTHDAVAGVLGAFKRLNDVLQRSSKMGADSLSAKVILTKDTILQEENIKKWLLEKGIQKIRVDVFVSFDDAFTRDLVIKEVFVNLFKRAPSNFRVPSETFLRLAKGHECWQDELAFTHSGEVLPCIAARHHIIGKIARGSLLDLLRTKQHFPYRNCGKDFVPACKGCEFRYGCSSCSLSTERILGTLQQRSWDCTYNPVAGEWGHPAIASE